MAFKYNTTSPTELIFKDYNMLNYNNMVMVQASKHDTLENPNGFRYSNVTSDVVVFAQYTNLQLKTNTNYIVEFMAYIETNDDNLRQGMDIDLIPDDLPQYNIQFDANGISNKPKKFTMTFNSSSSNMSSCSLRFFIDFTNSSGLRVVAPLVVYDIKFYEEGVLTTTNLTVLKYGNTPVWGKPYSLSISQGANTTVTITRTSSPNQGASTGTLSSGSVVYYGDVLQITASANSGYNLSTFTVNGSSFTSGNTITVTSAISVVTTAIASTSWKTTWTGNNTTTSNEQYAYSDLILNAQAVRGAPTRIYGTDGTGTTFSAIELPASFNGPTGGSPSVGNGGATVHLQTNGNGISVTAYPFSMSIMGSAMWSKTSITITKVEQYY